MASPCRMCNRRKERLKASTGFSDVDGSDRADELVDYLSLLADRLADVRRQGYAMLRIDPGRCGA